MKIKVACAKRDADYVRSVRTRTLESMGINPNREMVQPSSFATYVVAYNETGSPMGLAESAMLGDVYGSYSQSPYASFCDLSRYCPINKMAGTRTIFVEPEYRTQTGCFLALIFASAKIFQGCAEFATATTSQYSNHLHRLYEKCGGEMVGNMRIGDCDSSLFVFNVQQIINFRPIKRYEHTFEIKDAFELVS